MEIVDVDERTITIRLGPEEAREIGHICRLAARQGISGHDSDVCWTIASFFEVSGLACVGYSYDDRLNLTNWREQKIGDKSVPSIFGHTESGGS